MCMFLADILLIQSNTGTPADLLELCPGGQPKTGKKREKTGAKGRDTTSDKF